MKRDWDMIRDILMAVEELEPNALLTLDNFPADKHNEVSYHLEILEEGGLLRGKIHKTPGGSPHSFHLIRLTWAGHDFLESIRKESLWQAIKTKLDVKNTSLGVESILAASRDLSK